MAIASFVISIFAALFAGLGLGWTIFEWHRSGARLRVEVTSFYAFGGLGPGREGIAFDVTNSGRTATTVTSVGWHVPDGTVLIPSEPSMGPNPIPGRLDSGASLTFPVEPSEVLNACAEKGCDVNALRPYAKSGHGTFKGKTLAVASAVLDRAAKRS